MSPEGSRRFTDREVALVLRKASEIEDAEGSGAGGGLSLKDLEEIGREVGISGEAIAKAVAGLDRPLDRVPGLGLAPLVRRSVHAVRGELNEEAMSRLVRVVDERTDSAGAVTEALGSVRWTGSGRFHSTQVSFTPGKGETTIQVVEKARPHLRRVLHLVPAAWGAILAGAAVDGLIASPGAAAVAGVLAVGLAGGVGAGRAAWSWVSARSAARVERLAADLAREAHAATGAGLVARGGGGEDAEVAPTG